MICLLDARPVTSNYHLLGARSCCTEVTQFTTFIQIGLFHVRLCVQWYVGGLEDFFKVKAVFFILWTHKISKNKKKSTVGCLLAFFLIVYHKLQIKTSTVCPLISMAQTVRIWRGSDTRPNKDTCFCVLVKYLLSATSIKLDGICFCMLCCSGYCFVTEWHIHSQAGLEMNADTVHHGYFGVFIFSTSLPSPLLFFPVF